MANNRNFLLCLIFSLGFTQILRAQTPMDVSPPLSIDIMNPLVQTRVVPIIVTNNTGIDAYTLILTYPTNLLTFVDTDSAGTGTDGWTFSSGNETSAGTLVVTGFTLGTAFTADDTLINIIFTDTGVLGTDQVVLSSFQDDIANATTSPGTINVTLPVELVSFSAEVSANDVMLSWRTASETNNFGFEIQKSFDETEFTKIGFIPGNGTSTVPHAYSFSDTDLDRDRPVRFYRLKQIDLDGAVNFSGVLSVTLSAPQEFTLAQNYPNPFNPETTINYELPQPSQVSLVIYNMVGQVVRNLIEQEMPGGFHSVIWNGKDDFGKQAPSGAYIYKMRANDFTNIRKLTLLR